MNDGKIEITHSLNLLVFGFAPVSGMHALPFLKNYFARLFPMTMEFGIQ